MSGCAARDDAAPNLGPARWPPPCRGAHPTRRSGAPTRPSPAPPNRRTQQGRRPGEGLSDQESEVRAHSSRTGCLRPPRHTSVLCELTAPSVTGVGPEATARRFSSGRVGRGHSYSYEVTTPRPVSAHEPRSGRTTDPHSRPESQSHDGSEPPLRGSPTSSLSHNVTEFSAPTPTVELHSARLGEGSCPSL